MASTTTVQSIVNGTSQDVRSVLANSGSDATILIDYVNRISLQMLRQSNWTFLLSAPQRFVTREGVNDYWLGATGAGPAGSFDTGLNLTDLRTIKPETVFDRSNYVVEAQFDDMPLSLGFSYRDASSTLGKPRTFKLTMDNSSLLSLYPAPDNQNTYLPIPEPALCTVAAGGALAARTYYVNVTLVDSAGGESTASVQETKIFVAANNLVTVKSPNPIIRATATGVTYTGYKVYASTTTGGEVLQNGGASITLGTDWTEPNTGLVTGTAAAPTTGTIEPLGGYVIEFRYYKNHTALTALTDVLQIPDEYKDVVIAGTNWLAYKYLKKYDEAADWRQIYSAGIRDLVRNKYLFPEAKSDFIRPDPMSVVPTKNPVQDTIF